MRRRDAAKSAEARGAPPVWRRKRTPLWRLFWGLPAAVFATELLFMAGMSGCLEEIGAPGSRRAKPTRLPRRVPLAFRQQTDQIATSTTASVRIGEAAPDFSLRTVDGDTFTLSAFKGKKVVVLGVGNPFG